MLPVRVRISAVLSATVLSFVLSAALSVRAQTLPAEQQRPLNVMSFNIRYGTADDGPNAWPARKTLLLSIIRRHAPDVLALQEALRPQLDELRSAMPEYEEIGVGRDDGAEAGEYAAILCRRARVSRIWDSTFWFSRTPAIPGSRHWGNTVTRICTMGLFRDVATGQEFYVYNVHLDHESQASRDSSVEMLLHRIQRRSPLRPLFVTGDFNMDESNPAILRLLREPAVPASDGGIALPLLSDLFRRLHPPQAEEATYHGFTGKSNGARIDFVLASAEWDCDLMLIDRTDHEGRYPSDHFPVIARLRNTAPVANSRTDR